MVNRIAGDGYVVIALFWQTYDTSPSDAEVEALIKNSIAYLETRGDVYPLQIQWSIFQLKKCTTILSYSYKVERIA